MRDAGYYNVAFVLLRETDTHETDRGSIEEDFAQPLGYLFGNLELTGSSEESAYGAIRAKTTGVVRLRGFPEIKTQDRLKDGWGREWFIDGFHQDRPANETIADVHGFAVTIGL